jgi:hypothetical protein
VKLREETNFDDLLDLLSVDVAEAVGRRRRRA